MLTGTLSDSMAECQKPDLEALQNASFFLRFSHGIEELEQLDVPR